MSDSIVDLRTRVEQLEARLADAAAEVRRLRAEHARAGIARRMMGVVAGITIAVFWTTVQGQTAGPTIQGPTRIRGSLQVVDGSDHIIMSVGSGPGGRGLTLYRENNELAFRAGIAQGLGNPGLALYRFDGSIAVHAGIPDVGPSNPYVKVQAGNDLNNIAIGLQDQNPLLVVRSGDPRKPVAALGAVGGRPRLDLTNLTTGGGVVTLEQTQAGNGALLLSNAQGQATVMAGTTVKGAGKVEVLPGYSPGGSPIPATVIEGLPKK